MALKIVNGKRRVFPIPFPQLKQYVTLDVMSPSDHLLLRNLAHVHHFIRWIAISTNCSEGFFCIIHFIGESRLTFLRTPKESCRI